MENSTTPKTNPMDDYENGVITFDELCAIINALPQKELSEEEQEYYWKLSEQAERGDFGIAPDAKVYRGEEASRQGRAMLRAALEPQ